LSRIRPTGVPLDTLAAIGKALVAVPEGIKLHASLTRIMKAKEDTLKAGAWPAQGVFHVLLFDDPHRAVLRAVWRVAVPCRRMTASRPSGAHEHGEPV
jgi:hypothetical protein